MDITGQIVDAAMKVHTALGPGLLESAYEACLAHELKKRRFSIERQKEMPVEYDGILIDIGYRLDLLVNDKVCLLYTSPSPRDKRQSRMPSSA